MALSISTESTMLLSKGNESNSTMDIIAGGCFKNFNTIACIRNGLLTFLALLTAFLCILKLVRLHMRRHHAFHQYFIFYCASLECLLAAVHWILGSYIQLDFVLQYLKLIQFLVMCHFYWTLATRALRKEILAKRILVPFLVVACSYFTVISVLGIVHMQDSTIECLAPYWLMLSAAEFAIVQLFMVAGFYITRRLNEISTLDSLRWSQKRDLWCIIIVFEISALVGVLYDLSVKFVGNKDTGCSAIFLDLQELYSPIFITFMVIKLLVPIWVMLCVFQPVPPAVDQEDLLPGFSEDGTYTSIFHEDQQYRQLYHPSEHYQSTDDSGSPTSPGIGPSASIQSIANKNTSLTPISEENTVTPSTPDSPDSERPAKGTFFI